jgi:hypothetical protein
VLGLRDSVLNLLSAYAPGPRPIQTQLCVCLANLAIQMTQWKDVLVTVGNTLGGTAGDCVLEFLRILPEEVTEGRKINLSVRLISVAGAFCSSSSETNALLSFRKRILWQGRKNC